LDLSGEVVVLPAGVAEVGDLDLESLRQSALRVVEGDFMLEFFK
jgi:hypothetical protein